MKSADELKGLKPKVIDAKVAGKLAGKFDPEGTHFKEALHARAMFVTQLREDGLWPDWVRRT